MNTIKETLFNLRNNCQLPQKEMADKFHIPYQTYIQWENGRRNPPEYIVELISEIVKKDEKLKNVNQFGINEKLEYVINKLDIPRGKDEVGYPIILYCGNQKVTCFSTDEELVDWKEHTIRTYKKIDTAWGCYVEIYLN